MPGTGRPAATLVAVPALVLVEADSFLRENRAAIRNLVAELSDARTRYEYEFPLASDIVRALDRVLTMSPPRFTSAAPACK